MPLLERVQQPIGSSGYPLIGNESWRADEYNVDLATPQQAAATYAQMWKSDAKVRASGNNLLYALLAAEWRTDAAKEDPQGEELAQFVRSVLMPGESYGYSGGTPWMHTLRNLSMAAFNGVAVIEKVMGFRPSDAKQVYAALEVRLAKSIKYFTLTKRGPSRLESVTQFVQDRNGDFGDRTMKADRLIVNVFNQEGDSYWGESVLRPAHFHWRRKRSLLKYDAITKERMGGIFWANGKEGATVTDDQIRAAKLVLENFRIHEKLGLYFPSNMELHAIFPSGEGGNFIGSVRYDDEQIEQSMMSSFQSLGTGEKGARSVGEVQLDFMLLAYQGFARQIENVLMEQAIVPLVNMNFGEREFYPKIACENFLQMKPDRLATVLDPMIKNGSVRIDKPLRVYMRKKFSLPEEDESTMEPFPGAVPPGGEDPEQEKPGQKPKPKEEAEKTEKLRKRGQATPFWRDAFTHEASVDWDGVAKLLDEEPILIWHRVVGPARLEFAYAIANHFAEASDLQQARRSYAPEGEDELVKALADELLDVYRRGRRSILQDRARQVASLAKAAYVDPDEEEEDEPTATQRKDVSWISRGFVAVMIGSLIQRAIEAGQVSRDAGRPPERQERDIFAALMGPDGLSVPVQQANLAGRVARVYTNGRVQQIQAMKQEVSSVFYSARMDTSTCDPCWAMDGQELDVDTFASQCPNPDCNGLDRCRCQPVVIFRAEKLPEAA